MPLADWKSLTCGELFNFFGGRSSQRPRRDKFIASQPESRLWTKTVPGTSLQLSGLELYAAIQFWFHDARAISNKPECK